MAVSSIGHNEGMKNALMTLLGIGLLSACSSAPPTDSNTGTTTPIKDVIPAVPRVVRDTFNCAVANPQPISGQLPGNPRDTGNVISRLRPQASGGVWDLLYGTKYLLNTYYFGYSNAGLEALHAEAYQNFKRTYPNALSTYAITSQVDPLMNDYVAPIEAQDEHTYYLNAQAVAYFKSVTSNTSLPTPIFGLSFAPVPGGNGIVITDVRGDGPAFAANLRRGDVLLSLDGQPLNRTVSARGADDSAQAQLYSKVISAAAARKVPVNATIRRGSTPGTVTLTGVILGAARQPWSEVIRDASGNPYLYLRLPTFEADGAGAKVHELLAQAHTQQVKGVIVDLRNNGGGLLTEFVSAAAAFVPTWAGETVKFVDGSTAAFRYRDGQVWEESSCRQPTAALTVAKPTEWQGKVAVLVNGGSASASEMFSANLRQGGQARVIGEETYGVGNTSTFVFNLPGALGLSVTAGRVYLNGEQASKTIQPDTDVPDDMAVLSTGLDTALQTALRELAP